MMFNDCSKAETKKKPPEEVSELTYQELYDTMLRQKEIIKVLQGEIDKLQKEYFGTEPEEGQEEEQDTQPLSWPE